MCIVLAAPFAVAGFFSYNGMTFEQFLWAYIKSEIILAGARGFRGRNLLLEAMNRSEGVDE